MVQWLLAAGADVAVVTKTGETPEDCRVGLLLDVSSRMCMSGRPKHTFNIPTCRSICSVARVRDIARLNGHEAIVRILAEPASKRQKSESSELGPTESGETAGAASSDLVPTESGETGGTTSSAQGGAGKGLTAPPPNASSDLD